MLRRYTQGQIVTTLNRLQSSIPGATYNLHNDYAMKSDSSATGTAATEMSSLTKSTTGKSAGSFTKASSRYRGSTSSYTPRQILQPAKRIVPIHAIEVDMQDPLDSLLLPDEMTERECDLCNRYTSYVNSIQKSPTMYDISLPCRVCNKPGHNFDGCEILKNEPLLRAHYIGYCIETHRLRKIAEKHTADIHRLTTENATDYNFNNLNFRSGEN